MHIHEWQMLKTQQECVDTYLEDCILDTVDKLADDESRSHIQQMAEKINDVAYDMEKSWDNTKDHFVVVCFPHETNSIIWNWKCADDADAPSWIAKALWPN